MSAKLTRSAAPSIFLTSFLLLLAAGVAGDEIANEPFDYDPGDMNGEDGGEGWATPWTASLVAEIVDTTDAPLRFAIPGGGTVEDGGRALELVGNDDNAVFRQLDGELTDDDVFVRFLLRFEGTIDDNDFIGMWFDSVTFGTHTGVPSIGLKSNQGNGAGPLDVFARIGLGAEAYTEDIEPGATYLIVGHLFKSIPGELEFFDTYELWVNPGYEDAGAPEAAAFGASAGFFDHVGVRVPTFDPDDSVQIASLRIGTTWDDVVPPVTDGGSPRFARGDANADGARDLTDAVSALNFLFLAGPGLPCAKSGDSDDNGQLDLTDAVFLLNFLFLSGPPLTAPFPDCGIDSTADALRCDDYPPCQ